MQVRHQGSKVVMHSKWSHEIPRLMAEAAGQDEIAEQGKTDGGVHMEDALVDSVRL